LESLCGKSQKYLVLVNPVGGTGNARQAYYSIATPILEQSDIDCEVIVTKYQHHATEIAAEMPLNTYDCVVAVGGDGLLSEGAFFLFCLNSLILVAGPFVS
jgi:sphingosine kinase